MARHKIIRTLLATIVTGASLQSVAMAIDPNDTLQLNAKAAVDRDAKLKDLNLWISAREGVVLVTGGVPDEDTTAHIEKTLAKVPGVTIVRVTTWVDPKVDPLKKVFGDKLAGPKPAPVNPVQPALAMNPVMPGDVTIGIPPLPWNNTMGNESDIRPAGTVVAQRYEPTTPGSLLLAPVETTTGSNRLPDGIVVPPAPPLPAPYPTIASPRVPVAPVEVSSADTAWDLLKLRQSNPAYAALNVEVRDGVATIRGHVIDAKTKDQFAEAVGKISGVEKVNWSSK